MNTNIIDEKESIKIVATEGGNKAEAVVIGMSKQEVENNLNAIVEAHSLTDKL